VPPGKRQPDQVPLLTPSRVDRSAAMDAEILDVEGAAHVLGVSTRTGYNLACKGDIPAMNIGREWRCAVKNISAWGAHAVRPLTLLLHCGMAGASENGCQEICCLTVGLTVIGSSLAFASFWRMIPHV